MILRRLQLDLGSPPSSSIFWRLSSSTLTWLSMWRPIIDPIEELPPGMLVFEHTASSH